MTIKAIEVVPRIAAASSGPSVSVPSLCRALQGAGIDTRLVALCPAPDQVPFEPAEFHPSLRIPLAGRLGVSPALRNALRDLARSAQIMHTHSLWMMPNIYPRSAVKGTSCQVVVSPRGTLSTWALRRSRWRKALIWYAGQKQLLHDAACIHVTSAEELSEVRELRLRNPVAVIPNGVECPRDVGGRSVQGRQQRVLLFLARIHPKKGTELLLNAWQDLSRRFPDWCLRIVGPLDNAYAQQMVSLSRQRALPRVEFPGEATGKLKTDTWQDADLYVLPTHSENFGISVAEALAHGVPSVVFQGAPWSGLETHQAGWWIPPGLESLQETLSTAMSLPDDAREQMGVAGRRWMQSEFDWTVIGRRMAAVYQWLVDGGTVPPDVVI